MVTGHGWDRRRIRLKVFTFFSSLDILECIDNLNGLDIPDSLDIPDGVDIMHSFNTLDGLDMPDSLIFERSRSVLRKRVRNSSC